MPFAAFLPLATLLVAANPDARIRVNTIGFLPDAPKAATVATSCRTFEVVRTDDGAVVYEHAAGAAQRTPSSDTGETVQVLDFSALQTPGTYRVIVPDVGSSQPFTISQAVWNEPFTVVARAMYLWRCGTAVSTTWHGHTYAHGPCHLDDAWMDFVGGGHVRHPSVGGWHDAGDYNKYPVNAGVSLGFMLKAWEQFGDRIAHVQTGIPESGNNVPDLLDEVRWEAEWLLTTQAEDGRVYHKVSAQDFSYWGPPDQDHSPRYFAPWSTAATADFAAMMAETARAWRPYDTAFADRCLMAAQRSWAFLLAHPKDVQPDLKAFKTGAYQTKDGSHRLWAAAELWETTGDAAALSWFEEHVHEYQFLPIGPVWGDVRDLAVATYLLSHRSGRADAVVAELRKSVIAAADHVVATDRASAYGRPLGGDRHSWNWGDNGVVAGQTLVLHLADALQPNPAYRATAQDALSYLFGRNYHARSYVTGLGANPPEHPHDRRGGGWPGYLVGGPWPTGRDWEDAQENYRVNEIAINWNAALIYALAPFVDAPTGR